MLGFRGLVGHLITPVDNMNISIIGRIYHVVDKTTGEVVKVGSTIRTLEKRWNFYDKEKFSNHFLRLVKEIESSDLDWYSPDDSKCPFLWHLAASEHMEIVRIGTFNNGRLSNKLSPLIQKYIGFDANEAAKFGGAMGGIVTRDKKVGIHNPDFDHGVTGRINGLANVRSGHLRRISSSGGKVSGAIQGQKNAESGRMREVQKMGLGIGAHTNWHVNGAYSKTGNWISPKINPNCKFCKDK